MAIETNNPGFIDSGSYFADPANVKTPDQTHQEYTQGINSYVLSQLGGGGDVTEAEFLDLKQAVGMQAIQQAIATGTTVSSNYLYAVDEYEDETGVDSTTMTYESATDSYRTATGGGTHNLLMQSESSDGNTTDISAGSQAANQDSTNTHTATFIGNVDNSTDQAKFGSTSFHFPGSSGDTISFPASTDWDINPTGSESFTVDFWVYDTTSSGTDYVMGLNSNSAGGYSWSVYIDRSVGRAGFGGSTNGTALYSNIVSANSSVPQNTWTHCAFVYTAGTGQWYINGVASGSSGTFASGFHNVPTQTLTIGDFSPTQGVNLNGYLEEVSILKGTARIPPSGGPSSPYTLSNADPELDSVTFTAGSAPTKVAVVMVMEPIDSVTVNTDYVVSVSPTATYNVLGTDHANVTMTLAGTEPLSGGNIYVGEVDVSGLTSGTSLRYFIRGGGGLKDLRQHAAYIYYAD